MARPGNYERTKTMPANSEMLLNAVSFAARAHRKQYRKDALTPYISHPVRVAFILHRIFKINDESILAVALLHDTIEDTRVDYDDLASKFGPRVAGWVGALSKDKRIEEGERETRYANQLQTAPWQVQIVKLADIYDNVTDAAQTALRTPVRKTLPKIYRYLDAIKHSARNGIIPKAVSVVEILIKEKSKRTLKQGKKR